MRVPQAVAWLASVIGARGPPRGRVFCPRCRSCSSARSRAWVDRGDRRRIMIGSDPRAAIVATWCIAQALGREPAARRAACLSSASTVPPRARCSAVAEAQPRQVQRRAPDVGAARAARLLLGGVLLSTDPADPGVSDVLALTDRVPRERGGARVRGRAALRPAEGPRPRGVPPTVPGVRVARAIGGCTTRGATRCCAGCRS